MATAGVQESKYYLKECLVTKQWMITNAWTGTTAGRKAGFWALWWIVSVYSAFPFYPLR